MNKKLLSLTIASLMLGGASQINAGTGASKMIAAGSIGLITAQHLAGAGEQAELAGPVQAPVIHILQDPIQHQLPQIPQPPILQAQPALDNAVTQDPNILLQKILSMEGDPTTISYSDLCTAMHTLKGIDHAWGENGDFRIFNPAPFFLGGTARAYLHVLQQLTKLRNKNGALYNQYRGVVSTFWNSQAGVLPDTINAAETVNNLLGEYPQLQLHGLPLEKCSMIHHALAVNMPQDPADDHSVFLDYLNGNMKPAGKTS